MVERLIVDLRQQGVLLKLENERLICDAPKGVMTADLLDQVRQNKDAIVELLKLERDQSGIASGIPRVARDIEIPLSFSQESLWFLEQLNHGTSAYIIPLKIRIPASVDSDVLQRTLNEVVRRHEILRTKFCSVNGSPTQIISPPCNVPLAIIDLSTVSAEIRAERIEHSCFQEATKVFQLDQDLMLRATLLRLEAEDHILLLTMHHIASDATSVDLIFREIFFIYRAYVEGVPLQLEDPHIQYADFAVWQRSYVSGGVTDRQLMYWKRQMADAPPVLELPIDWPRLAIRSFKSSTETAEIPSELTTRLRSFSRNENASLFMTLLAAFQVLLYRCSGQPDIVVGSPISGRKFRELESVIGLFVNSLPLRIDLSGNPPFRRVLSRVREVVLEAHENQDIPFEELVKELRPPRDPGRNPLFQVFFSFRSRVGDNQTAGVSSEVISGETAKFDLSLSLEEFSDCIKAEIEYCTDLFRRERVLDVLKRLTLLLESITKNPAMGVDDLPVIDEFERQQALVEFNQADVEQGSSRSVDDFILETVRLTPEHEAVRFGKEALNYKELSDRADEIALLLCQLGVGPEDVVGLCVERSLDLVVGLLAILRAGAAFVPLDPQFPKERLAYMLRDASPVAILTQKRTADAISNYVGARICLDDLPPSDRKDANSKLPTREKRSTDLAYVIYTSGSTGSPKGVEVSHRSLTNFLNSMRQQLGVTPNVAVLAVTTISFDIAIMELLLPLVCGGRVVLASPKQAADATELVQLLQEEKISMMQATPTTWRLLLDAGWGGNTGLTILCGGEPWSEDLARPLLARCDALWNMYGPTETTIWSAARKILPGDKVLIGPPIANTQFLVLGPNNEPQPTYLPGELIIGGTGTARGYRGRPDLTAEKFIANPFGSNGQDRLYKTGDRVRRLPNGDLEFLGRLDNQIKLRGYRIEPDEIAAVLRSHPSVADAVVVVYGNEHQDKRLVAYCTSASNDRPTDEALRSFSRSKLPSYMVPSSCEFLERFPVTPNGKTDRKALERRVPSVNVSSKVGVPPRTDVERTIAKTWEKFLGVKALGISDDFFEAGAHSLMVVQVIHELGLSFGFRLGVAEIFENPTVEKLAAIVEERQPGYRRTAAVIELQQGGTDVPIYFIYAGPAELALAKSIGGSHPVFGIEMPWPLEWRKVIANNQTERYPDMAEVVDRFVAELWRHLGTGKCVLAGYSFAGLLAFEVARRLLEKGGQVESVIVIDKSLPYPPTFSVAWKNLGDTWRENRTEGKLRNRVSRSGFIIWWAMEMLAKRMASSLWLRPNELTAFLDEEGIPLRWYLIERLYTHLERNHKVEPLACRGIILRPEYLDRYHTVKPPDEFLGWKTLFEGGSEALHVAGDHFSMVREHGRALAQHIADAIKEQMNERAG
jgi:amino acid adenylation domain-containing protein